MLRKSLAFVVVALLLAAGASAQSVGLVLSGGGAKGLYHIGVIQALEENEIPIDYVAGTSMGSIIAALYAAGYSPEEMRAIVDSGQVREWVSGRIDSRYASYYRQMQDQPSMLTLRLNLRDEEKRSDAKNKSRLVLPSHLISSSQIDLALAELLTPASTPPAAISTGSWCRSGAWPATWWRANPMCSKRATWAKRCVLRWPFRWRSTRSRRIRCCSTTEVSTTIFRGNPSTKPSVPTT